ADDLLRARALVAGSKARRAFTHAGTRHRFALSALWRSLAKGHEWSLRLLQYEDRKRRIPVVRARHQHSQSRGAWAVAHFRRAGSRHELSNDHATEFPGGARGV